MISFVTLTGGAVVVGLAALKDPSKTVELGINILAIRGSVFLAKRIVHTMNKDYGDIIDFAGWCLAGISVVAILKLSMDGMATVQAFFDTIQAGIDGIGEYFNRFADFVDRITFWN